MLITLTTDFGYKDPFVGLMKGVIASIHPKAHVIDLSHGVAPQDILGAALVLRHSVNYFPQGTIHVVVVDPGVGGARKPILIESNGSYYIGPDNGVLSLALPKQAPARIIHLTNAAYHRHPVSATFHGRDIFAPVAAHLSLTPSIEKFGDPVSDFHRLDWPQVIQTAEGLMGEVLYIDGFGNLFTNIDEHLLSGWDMSQLVITLGNMTVKGIAPNYVCGAEGEYVAVINSWGLLEIAVCKGSAQQACGARPGDRIQLRAR